MTLAYWCVLVAAILPAATLAVAKLRFAHDYDNRRPRDPDFYRSGFRARAYWAHLNGYEAFPFFATAVVIAHIESAPQEWIDGLAAVFILARLGYVACYYADRPTLRTAAWTVGFVATIGIFVLPAV